MLLGEVADAVERGDIAIHTKDAVGHDQAAARVRRLGNFAFEIGDIDMGVTHHLGAAQPAGVDNTGMVEFIG